MSDAKKIGPWEIHEKLGEGSNASVYHASRGDEQAALKVINAVKATREPYRLLNSLKRDGLGLVTEPTELDPQPAQLVTHASSDTTRGSEPYLFASVRARADAGGAGNRPRRSCRGAFIATLMPLSPILPTRKPCFQGFRMGGTGLEATGRLID